MSTHCDRAGVFSQQLPHNFKVAIYALLDANTRISFYQQRTTYSYRGFSYFEIREGVLVVRAILLAKQRKVKAYGVRWEGVASLFLLQMHFCRWCKACLLFWVLNSMFSNIKLSGWGCSSRERVWTMLFLLTICKIFIASSKVMPSYILVTIMKFWKCSWFSLQFETIFGFHK